MAVTATTRDDAAIPVVPRPISAAIGVLPLAPLGTALGLVLGAVLRRHRRIFDRLGTHAGKRFGLRPTDLPFALILHADPARPRITLARRLPRDGLHARIAGPLAGLAGLVDGRLDGDALFFSRVLSVEGDIEAVVALRNAIDDAGIDLLGDAASLLGPFARPAERIARTALDVAGGFLHPTGGPKGGTARSGPWN